MSKIGEYQAALRKLAEERERQSVGDFAKELRKTPEALLIQLNKAGVIKTSATDSLSFLEKNSLLKWLQGPSTPRKKISVKHDPIERRLIRAVAEQKNGAEFEVLEYVLSAVIRGDKLPHSLQALVNIVVAKCLLVGALPLRRLGRPKQEGLESIGLHAAERYWSLVDSGATYQEAVGIVSSEIHKSDRHVMRLIAKHKKQVGETFEERNTRRKFRDIQMQIFTGIGSAGKAPSVYAEMFKPPIPLPELTLDDYFEYLDELTDRLASKAKPLTEKI